MSNVLQRGLAELADELRMCADVAAEVGYDTRTTVGDAHQAHGRQVAFDEAANMVDELRGQLLAPQSTLLDASGQVIASVPMVRA